MMKRYPLAVLVATVVFTAFGAKAGTITTDSTGTIMESFPSSSGGTDGRGDTVTGSGDFFMGHFLMVAPYTLTVNFVSPVTEFGLDVAFETSADVETVTLSNGDTFSPLPQSLPNGGYLGFISTLGGGFASVTITGDSGNSTELTDFRLTAASVPEPTTLALLVPALLACVAGFRLRKR